MLNSKEERLKLQIKLNEKFIKKYDNDEFNLTNFNDVCDLKTKLSNELSYIVEGVTSSNMCEARMIDNLISYIEEGKTNWSDENIVSNLKKYVYIIKCKGSIVKVYEKASEAWAYVEDLIDLFNSEFSVEMWELK